LGEDKRARIAAEKKATPDANEGTVVLSNTQLDRMLNSIRENEERATLEPEPTAQPMLSHAPAVSSNRRPILLIAAALLAGIFAGALIAWAILSRAPSI
jgi:hypothetical protein